MLKLYQEIKDLPRPFLLKSDSASFFDMVAHTDLAIFAGMSDLLKVRSARRKTSNVLTFSISDIDDIFSVWYPSFMTDDLHPGRHLYVKSVGLVTHLGLDG